MATLSCIPVRKAKIISVWLSSAVLSQITEFLLNIVTDLMLSENSLILLNTAETAEAKYWVS